MDRQRKRIGEWDFDLELHGPPAGRPVVLLHGFPETAACWRPVAEMLAEHGIRTVSPNQRGYSPGARPLAVADYAMENLVADVIGLLDVLGVERVDLVGHDWGAAVAWAAAGMRPDRVRSLTAVSTPHPAAFGRALSRDGEQRQKSAYIELLQREGVAEKALLDNDGRRLRGVFGDDVPPDLVAEHLAALSDPAALTGALNWYRAMGRWAGDDQPTRVPTTYIWGAQDQALGRAGAHACGDHVSADYRFVELPDVGHWIPEQRPEVIVAEILARRGGGAS